MFFHLGLVSQNVSYDSASISWNDFVNLDQSQFKQYVIQVKKRYTTVEAETPRTFSSLVSNYDIIGLESALDYEISVLMETIDFGQSNWSDSIMLKTLSLTDSDPSDIDQLKIQVVRIIIFFYNFFFLESVILLYYRRRAKEPLIKL